MNRLPFRPSAPRILILAALSLAARLPKDFPGSGLFGDIVMRRPMRGQSKQQAKKKDNR